MFRVWYNVSSTTRNDWTVTIEIARVRFEESDQTEWTKSFRQCLRSRRLQTGWTVTRHGQSHTLSLLYDTRKKTDEFTTRIWLKNRFSFSTSQLSLSLSPYSPFLDHCISWLTRLSLSSGGALNTGSSDRYFYDPTSLIRSQSSSQRCIVVTGNYRINIFGFLSCPELSNADSEGLSGNYGLYDCVKLFEWVRIHLLSYSSLCTGALS